MKKKGSAPIFSLMLNMDQRVVSLPTRLVQFRYDVISSLLETMILRVRDLASFSMFDLCLFVEFRKNLHHFVCKCSLDCIEYQSNQMINMHGF